MIHLRINRKLVLPVLGLRVGVAVSGGGGVGAGWARGDTLPGASLHAGFFGHHLTLSRVCQVQVPITYLLYSTPSAMEGHQYWIYSSI